MILNINPVKLIKYENNRFSISFEKFKRPYELESQRREMYDDFFRIMIYAKKQASICLIYATIEKYIYEPI